MRGNGGAEQRAAGGRDLLEAAEQAAAVLRRPFDHEGGRGAPFAAGREPLHDAKRNQQDRRPDADRLIGRQQADGDRAERHQEDGEHQRRLAAPGVAEAADHDAAERPRQEADAIGREGGEQRGGRIGCSGRILCAISPAR